MKTPAPVNISENMQRTWGESMITEKEINFYIVNHLDVLGVEEGLDQVAHRLAFNKEVVRGIYFNVKGKEKANQMAV